MLHRIPGRFSVAMATLALLSAARAQAPVHTSGDMVGSLQPTSALVWTRASSDAKVSVLYATNPALSGAQQTPQVVSSAAADYTAKVALGGLAPATDYWYATRLEDPLNATAVTVGPIGHFKTLPLAASDVAGRIAFSGDVLNPAEYALFDLVRAQGNDLYVSLGDYTYCDPSTTVSEYRNVHKAVRSYASITDFFRSTGAECIWDDHEVENDWNGATNPTKVQNGKAVWFEYFPVPANTSEIYRTVRWGKGVEIFLLDARSHRGVASAPDTPAKSMLGIAQKTWLKGALLASDARFKVIVSSMPLRYGHGIADSWWYAQNERKELFDFLTANEIANVVFLTADNHFMALHEHREGFREYMVGPVAQFIGASLPNVDPEVREQRFERNWGVLGYDPVARTLTVEAFGVNGRIHRSVLADAAPGKLRVQSDTPEATWSATGPYHLRNSGADVTCPRVEPGSYAITFAPVAGAPGQPLPISVDVAPGADVRVAASYRDTVSPTPVLFADAFEGSLAAYTIVDTGTNGLAPSWYLDNGYLYQGSNVSDGNAVSQCGTMAAFGATTWSDVTLSVRVRSFDDDVVGVAFRWAGKDDHYAFVLDAERSARRLLKRKNGVLTVLAQDTVGYVPHTWYSLQVVAVGMRLRAFVDGVQVFDVQDPDFAQGRCALLTGSNLLTSFDDLVVRSGDATAPGVTWLLRDTFATGLASWTVLDEGTLFAPSLWSTDQGVCRQTANIHTPEAPPYSISRPGTLLLRGNPAWTDYRFAVSMRNDDNDGFGIVFRHTDAANYYRLSWDNERNLRMLTKVKNGTWTVLQQDAIPYEIGRWYRVAAEVVGSRIEVTIDGALWADLQDQDLGAGQIGLYTWRSDNVSFDDVEVSTATPQRAVVAATIGTPTRITARTTAPAGSPYLLAMALSRAPGIPLALLQPGDPRVWPLAADSLFFTSLQVSPVFAGFQGFLPPSGVIDAQLNVPVIPVVAGLPYFVGGIVMNPGATAVREVLPSIELVFPR